MSLLFQMEKVDRVKKYSEFIRQQHKNNVVRTSEDQADDELFSVESRQRFTLGESERKKQELLERRKKVGGSYFLVSLEI